VGQTLKLTIAYDGARFKGWAAQPGERTVQGELEAALQQVCGRPVPLTAAGRTDAGVHARAQVASSPWDGEPPDHLLRALNATTPPDIAVNAVESVEGEFDARRDAISRTYCYRVEATRIASPFERGRALHWPYPVDRELLGACAEAIVGQHDFTAFTPTDTEHVFFERTIFEAEWRGEEVLEFWATADAWMRNMVRILVGTMLEAAGGKRSLDDFRQLLEGAPRERAGQTAPPHGLYLVRVGYTGA
jgi:tRNA pseudouridine38-40 synthase